MKKKNSYFQITSKGNRSGIWKKYKYLIILVFIILLFLAGFFVLNSNILAVDRILIEGNSNVDSKQIESASNVSIGSSMIEIDGEEISEQILKMGTIESVSVDRRIMSGDLIITVVERVPYIQMEHSNGYVLIDSKGYIIEIFSEKADLDLPYLDGEIITENVGSQAPREVMAFISLRKSISGDNSDLLTNYEVSDSGLSAELVENGALIKFGLEDDMDRKFKDLLTVINKVDMNCVEVIDVQIPLRPNVKRTPGC